MLSLARPKTAYLCLSDRRGIATDGLTTSCTLNHSRTTACVLFPCPTVAMRPDKQFAATQSSRHLDATIDHSTEYGSPYATAQRIEEAGLGSPVDALWIHAAISGYAVWRI